MFQKLRKAISTTVTPESRKYDDEGESQTTGGESNAEAVFASDEAVDLYTDRVQSDGLFLRERKAIDRFFTKSGGSVLDVGCGTGRVSHILSDEGFEVTGIDISEPLVNEARSLFPDVEFRVANVTDTDFESETFDYVIFSYYGLDYVLPKSNRIEALREIYRLLKPGGFFVFSSHNTWYLLDDVIRRDRSDLKDLYLSRKNAGRLFSRYKRESVPLGELEIYMSNPLHQWIQLRKCGFTLVDIVGRRESRFRIFERNPHYVAKK